MHKLTVQLDDKDGRVKLAEIARSLGYIKTRGAGAGHDGCIGAMIRALIRNELVVIGDKVVTEPKPSYKERYPERLKARQAIGNAVQRGEIQRVSTLRCTECPAQARVYHHDDYSKPLQVIPLCNKCHGLKHRTTNGLPQP